MIKSSDISERNFRKRFRGYDPVEVKYYLESLAEEFARLEERATKLEAIASEYERARKSYDKIVKEAREQAAQIILNGETIANNMITEAEHRKKQIEAEMTKLQHLREVQIHQIEELIKKSQQMLATLTTLEEFENEQQEELIE